MWGACCRGVVAGAGGLFCQYPLQGRWLSKLIVAWWVLHRIRPGLTLLCGLQFCYCGYSLSPLEKSHTKSQLNVARLGDRSSMMMSLDGGHGGDDAAAEAAPNPHACMVDSDILSQVFIMLDNPGDLLAAAQVGGTRVHLALLLKPRPHSSHRAALPRTTGLQSLVQPGLQ